MRAAIRWDYPDFRTHFGPSSIRPANTTTSGVIAVTVTSRHDYRCHPVDAVGFRWDSGAQHTFPYIPEETVFLMDKSGSMGGSYQAATISSTLARAIITLILQQAKIDPRDMVALVSFDDAAKVEFPLLCVANDRAKMIEIIQSLQDLGGTDINEAPEGRPQSLRFQQHQLQETQSFCSRMAKAVIPSVRQMTSKPAA